jgi:hypothetical protein
MVHFVPSSMPTKPYIICCVDPKLFLHKQKIRSSF